MLKVGDKVMWRGSWGMDDPKVATVESIDINCVNKCGMPADEVSWAEVNSRSVMVGLDNGHWAYGDQITNIQGVDSSIRVGYNCEHEWKPLVDSQFHSEQKIEVVCLMCGCHGEQDVKTGKVFWPAT